MTFTREELAKLHEVATPGNLETAETHVAEEYLECPFCTGNGEVLAADYCNFDDIALGVQFYGIGHEFGIHEKLWTLLCSATSRQQILDMMDEVERLRAALVRLRDCDWKISLPDRMDAVRDIARAALGEQP